MDLFCAFNFTNCKLIWTIELHRVAAALYHSSFRVKAQSNAATAY